MAKMSSLPVHEGDRKLVTMHPSGDRYVVATRSPAPRGERGLDNGHAAAPAAWSKANRDWMKGSERTGSRTSMDHRREQDAQFLQYRSSWKHIATSKTEKEADQMIASVFARSPVRRSLEMGDAQGARDKFLSQALEGLGRPPQQVPKPMTLQDKNRRHLERMRQSWGIVDQAASKHSNQSLESFLTDDSSVCGGRSIQHISCEITPREESSRSTLASPLSFSPTHLLAGRAGHRYAPGTRRQHQSFLSAQASGTSQEAAYAASAALSEHGDRGSTGKRLAEEARSALATLGIQRPPSTAKRPPSSRRSLDSSHGSRWGTGRTDGQVTVSAVQEEVIAGGGVSEAPAESAAHAVPGQALGLPVPVAGESGVREASVDDDGAWDAELDDLLQWTDNINLCT